MIIRVTVILKTVFWSVCNCVLVLLSTRNFSVDISGQIFSRQQQLSTERWTVNFDIKFKIRSGL